MKKAKCIFTGIIILLLLAGTGTYCLAQSAQETQINVYLSQVQYWRYQYSPEDSGVNPNANPGDSLVAANTALQQYLLTTPSLNQNLSLNDDMTVSTSDDHKLRIFSWDTETGKDGAHIYTAIAQYESGSTVKMTVLNEVHKSGVLYPAIYTVASGSNRIYLPVFSRTDAEKDALKGVQAFSLQNGTLSGINIFMADNGNTSDKLSYTYDYFSNYDYKKMKEKYVIHINKQKLYIPAADGDKLNGNWIVYSFDGQKFVSDKNSK